MKVLHAEPLRYDDEMRAMLEPYCEVDYHDDPSQQAFLDKLSNSAYEAVFVRIGLDMSAEAFDQAPSLKYVLTPTTGLDHIDLTEAQQRGVTVLSLKGEYDLLDKVRSTAEHTWAILLSLIRKTPKAHMDVVAGNWRREPFLGDELYEKSLGILGCGRLGRMVAGYGLAFGMDVCVHDISEESISKAPAGVTSCSLEALLQKDVLSIHLPLNNETEGFISRDKIFSMKRGSYIVNTARGNLVDESALLEALESGHLKGAALDVLYNDSVWDGSVPDNHSLIEYAKTYDNLILTPHIGGYGLPAIRRTRIDLIQRFIELIE